ncbi:conserved hypothetical protein [Culex quinquefasciatus]|uniref:Uncharacterized protein n=1 Tax=Culex quinquefasciatus TaxID=7176 RepID=B0X3M9_CULQU|nr:conserved hypothetical protein [Culex quinquefasciatus]|eukprot:XP_001864251.1 conserved hypothetical protein [Culex quinquefasciatus]
MIQTVPNYNPFMLNTTRTCLAKQTDVGEIHFQAMVKSRASVILSAVQQQQNRDSAKESPINCSPPANVPGLQIQRGEALHLTRRRLGDLALAVKSVTCFLLLLTLAISAVNSRSYHTGTVIGLLPAQTINVYLGSKLRSIHEVLNDHHLGLAGYGVFVVEVIVGAALMVWVIQKARTELSAALLSDMDSDEKILIEIEA